MGRRKLGEHVRGPYKGRRGGWRLQYVFADGSVKDLPYPTRKAAERELAAFREALRVEGLTVCEVLDRYRDHLNDRGAKPDSIYQTLNALKRFLPDPDEELAGFVRITMERRYRELTKRYAVATHRNTLSQAKTFGAWLVEKRILTASPWAEIKGVGKRNRGKPQLRRVEARRWLDAALGVAIWGVDAVVYLAQPEPLAALQMCRNDSWAPADARAVAALCALLLGLRCSEIVRLRVRDLDTVAQHGDTVVVARSKSEAGVREVEVPELLRGFLVARARGGRPKDWLFPSPRSRSGRHDRNWPRHQVQWLCELAGVTRVCAHALRGMTATFALRAGAVGDLVARYLGHEDVSTTLGSYALPGSGDDAARARGLQVLRGGRDR